tara:strand:- start:1013 stop:1309 length:297 start_codon:yes stop_codon:yes gene_type:complete
MTILFGLAVLIQVEVSTATGRAKRFTVAARGGEMQKMLEEEAKKMEEEAKQKSEVPIENSELPGNVLGNVNVLGTIILLLCSCFSFFAASFLLCSSLR